MLVESPVSVQEVVFTGRSLEIRPPVMERTRYPTSFSPSLQVQVMLETPRADPLKEAGAVVGRMRSGALCVTTVRVESEALAIPSPLMARTVKEYVVPWESPVTVALVDVTVWVVVELPTVQCSSW